MKIGLRCVVSLLALSCASAAWTADEDEIRDQFSKYIKAIIAKDGKSAVECVDKKTEEWYQDTITDAVKADKAAILKMKPSHRITMLRLRMEFSKAELQKMTGREAIDMAVTRGWTGATDENKMKLVKVVVNGETAQGFIAAAPQVPLTHFKKESGKWMLELHRFMTIGDAFFAQTAVEAGMTEDALILMLLGEVSKKKVDESVYEPPK